MLKSSKKTSAEQTLIDSFETVETSINESEKAFQYRKTAFNHFKKKGLPSRKKEYWHYTDLRRLIKTVPEFVTNSGMLQKNNVFPNLKNSYLLSEKNDLPNFLKDTKVFVKRFSETLKDESYAINSEKILDQNIIRQLNAAYHQNGWDITVDGDLKKPIELKEMVEGQTHRTHVINIKKNSNALFLENYQSLIESTSEGFTTVLTQLNVAAGARVDWFIIHETEKNNQLSRLEVVLGEDSALNLYFINLKNNNTLRQEIYVTCEGYNAFLELRGLNLLSGYSHSDLTVTVDHKVTCTASKELIRNIVTDCAEGVFQGLIKVAREAQKTDAVMACNTLILSDQATFNAKPELQIFADDVTCGHGATFTQINKDHLFYLMARGIPKSEATVLLVKSFVIELLDKISSKEVETYLLSLLSNWFSKHVLVERL